MHLSSDVLEDEIILIKHHVSDITEALKQKETDYALEGLKDISESCDRLQRFLPGGEFREVNRAAPKKKDSRKSQCLTKDFSFVKLGGF